MVEPGKAIDDPTCEKRLPIWLTRQVFEVPSPHGEQTECRYKTRMLLVDDEKQWSTAAASVLSANRRD